MRKIVYPIVQWIGKGKWIDIIERKPFELMGNKTRGYSKQRIIEM
jgi:hypothetical protein